MAQPRHIRAIQAHGACRSSRLRHRCAGFSLIDLLVSIAVMAVLISVLLPVLGKVQENARRVICANQIRHIGLGISMYADEFDGHLPPATGLQEVAEQRFGQSPSRSGTSMSSDFQADTMQARSMMASVPTPSTSPLRPLTSLESKPTERWEGLGHLVPNYLDHPEACYCPSHRGHHSYSEYRTEWRSRSGAIYTNYQYRIPQVSPYSHDLDPRTTIVTDGMETKLDFNHVKGCNTLRVDGSVGWFIDSEGKVYASLPDTVTMTGGSGGGAGSDPNREPAWREFDTQGSSNSGSH